MSFTSNPFQPVQGMPSPQTRPSSHLLDQVGCCHSKVLSQLNMDVEVGSHRPYALPSSSLTRVTRIK